MLIKFEVENWMSFRDRVSFSMVASKETQHRNRIANIDKYKMRMLPVAAIYGGNASGKSNLFNALWFARKLITQISEPGKSISVEPFRLDSEKINHPSKFLFLILINGHMYEYGFSVSKDIVHEEKLVEIKRASEQIIFSREKNKIEFSKNLENDKRLHFVFEGTRNNQLFLTNSVSQKVDNFKDVFEWFHEKLVLISPDAKYGSISDLIIEEKEISKTFNMMIRSLDTGIYRIGGVDVTSKLSLSEKQKKELMDVFDRTRREIIELPVIDGDRLLLSYKNGEIHAVKLVSYHKGKNGKETEFDMEYESDGTKRLIDLLPAFIDISQKDSSKVYFIDEVERSLHTILIKSLLELFLSSCEDKEPNHFSQLIFTTHNVLLMDQKLLRRDEMWVTERDDNGSSSLYSFSEFKNLVRFDKDIRKIYLQGRLGGIPKILMQNLTCFENHDVSDKG